MELITNGKIGQTFNTWCDYNIAGHKTKTEYVNGKLKTFYRHEGIDIITYGTMPCKTLGSCVVEKVIDLYDESMKVGYGNQVYLKYKNGVLSRTCHLARDIMVKEGQTLASGQIYAYTGRTGYRVPESIWHTHYEEYINGERVDPMTSPNQLSQKDMELLELLRKDHEDFVLETRKRLDALENGQKEIIKMLAKETEVRQEKVKKLKKNKVGIPRATEIATNIFNKLTGK